MRSTDLSDPGLRPFGHFAGAHLSSEIDWAVFWVLAASLNDVWTVASVAQDARVSDHEADQTLRRFLAAGILELADEHGRPPRYRWGKEMTYLHTGNQPPGLRDPVCGMPVRADSPYTAEDGDREVRFCSLPCLVRWRKGLRV